MVLKRYSKQFKKSFRKLVRSGSFDREKIENVVNILARGESLPESYRDHALQGEFSGMRECHIKPDLLLVYKIHDDILILVLVDIGLHSELFG
jgi:mRNA interferase YafQ